MNGGYRARQRWSEARGADTMVTVDRGTSLAALRELGRRGLALTGWS